VALAFAVPDHPWVDSSTGAAVRVAMTVGARADRFDAVAGRLSRVSAEKPGGGGASDVVLEETTGRINADLTSGADVTLATPLLANAGLSNRGVTPVGTGFRVTEDEAARLGLGRIHGLDRHIRPYQNGKDVTATPRGYYIIDLLGVEENDARERFPEVYEHLLREVKPGRDLVRRASYRDRWWILGEARSSFRPALAGLSRFIATPYVAKHRPFVFLDASVLPDEALIAVASDDAFHLGVLSSSVHIAWALAAGGRLGVGNDPRYNNSRTFEPFPFPDASVQQAETVRTLGEAIDAHRKARQAANTDLGLTDLYNTVEALRAGRALSEKEEATAVTGLAHTLLDLHCRLDSAVLDCYGWDDLDVDAPTFAQAVLTRLAALNAERVGEEARGLVRYLRPSFQNPEAGDQTTLDVGVAAMTVSKKVQKTPWPKSTTERVVAVRLALGRLALPMLVTDVAAQFTRAREAEVADVLAALDALGLVERFDDGTYSV
ncbi:MAG TPA: type IIL restriction-modification enzyme MmeI, partial [Rubricoccaceae bacterium]